MRFHRVREVIEWAVRTHEQLAHDYDRLQRQCTDERTKMALRYLAEHERQMQAALSRYLADAGAHRNVLDTWFDDGTEFPHPALVARLCDAVGDKAVADLLANALAIHKTMEDLYRHRAEGAPIGDEHDFFAALAASHEAETRRLVRDMSRLDAL